MDHARPRVTKYVGSVFVSVQRLNERHGYELTVTAYWLSYLRPTEELTSCSSVSQESMHKPRKHTFDFFEAFSGV